MEHPDIKQEASQYKYTKTKVMTKKNDQITKDYIRANNAIFRKKGALNG